MSWDLLWRLRMTLEVYRVADRIWLQYSKYKRCKLELSHAASASFEVAVALFEALTLQSLEFTKKPGQEISIFFRWLLLVHLRHNVLHAIHLITEPQGFASSVEGECAITGWHSRQEEQFRKWHTVISPVASSYTYCCKNTLGCSSLCPQKGEGDLAMPQQSSSQPGPEKVAEAGPGGWGGPALTPILQGLLLADFLRFDSSPRTAQVICHLNLF